MFSGEVPGTSIYAVIRELCERSLSGELICKPKANTDSWTKKIWLWRGMICKCSSDLLDDRLGEILYRDGMLKFETFSEVAGQVSVSTRFGAVLVEQNVISSHELWEYLCLQSKRILESLCLYDMVSIQFNKSDDSPFEEFPLDESFDALSLRALRRAADVRRFERAMRREKELHLHPLAENIPFDDYTADLVQQIKSEPDFERLILSQSGVSREYTTVALFDLYVQGLLNDRLHLSRAGLSDVSAGAIQNDLNWANTMIELLAHAAKKENIDDWEEIIASSREQLRRLFGPGFYISGQTGFVASSFSRAIQYRQEFSALIVQSASSYYQPDVLISCFRQNLIDCLLYILFELYNRRPRSAEVRQVQLKLDSERSRWGWDRRKFCV